jgi:hypothetical protein
VLSKGQFQKMRLLRAGKHAVHVPERRAHTRHMWDVVAECRVGPHFDSWWPASILDLSASGATVALWGWGKPEVDISIRLIKRGRQAVAVNAAIQNISRFEDVWLIALRGAGLLFRLRRDRGKLR